MRQNPHSIHELLLFIFFGVPPLEYGDKPDIDFLTLFQKFEENLSKSDVRKLNVLRKLFDLQNIKKLLENEPIDPRGILDKKQLELALSNETYFDQYVFDFLSSYEESKEQVLHFSSLLNEFLKKEEKQAKGFLKRFFQSQRSWRFILSGFRSKKEERKM